MSFGKIFGKLYTLDFVTLYGILVAFFLVSATWVFGSQAYIYQNALLLYAVTFLILTKSDPRLSGGSVLKNLPMNILYTIVVPVVISFLPVIVIGSAASMISFPHPFIAAMWYVGIVAMSERLIFGKALAESIGDVPASILFAVFHTQTLFTLSEVTMTVLGIDDIVIAFVRYFVLNMILIWVYRTTQSVYLGALIHGCIDLAKIGVLTIIIGGLI